MASSQRYERVSLFREGTMKGDVHRRTSSKYSFTSEQEVPKFNYKPVILRTISLLILLLFTIALIGVLQYAAIKLPHGDGRLGEQSDKSNTTRRDLEQLHALLARDTSSQSAEGTASTAASSPSVSQAGTDAPTTSVSYSSASDVTEYIQSSNYVDTDKTTTVSAVAPSIATSNYVDPDGTSTPPVVASPASSEYVPTEKTQTITSPSVAMSISTSNYVNPDHTTTIAYSADTSVYVPTDKTQTITSPTATPTPTVIEITSSSAHVVLITDSKPTELTTTTTDQSGNIRTLTTHEPPKVSRSTELVPIVHTTTSTPTISNTQQTGTDSHTSQLENNGKDDVIEWHWNQGKVFVGTYLSVLLAVIYRILISVMHNNFTLIEPFRQLMEPKGALAERAFFSFFQDQSNLYGPFPALMKGRWALALVATAYLVASTLPALVSEAIWVNTNWDCAHPEDTSRNPCAPRMTVDITVVRVLQGLLAFVGVVILFVMGLLLSKKTGLPANPSSMATIGSLMRNPGMQDDINELMPVGPGATPSAMRAALAGRRYGLGTWKSETGTMNYGIRPLSTGDSSDSSSSIYSKGRGSYTPVDGNHSFDDMTTKSHRLRWMDLLLLFFILGTFGVVLAYYLDGNNDGFNNFFSSNTFGPRFILTGAGTVIATSWRTVEQSSVVMSPYIRLSQGPSPAKGTITFAPSNTPLLSTWTTLRNRYWLAAFVTVITLLAEALNIVISGVPFATGQTWNQFLISSYMSIGILGIMILVAIFVIFHRSREPKIPLHPDTLAGKMYYISSSRMLDDFEGMEFEKQKKRDKELQKLGKRYRFMPMMRKDGRRTWVVDEVTGGGPQYS